MYKRDRRQNIVGQPRAYRWVDGAALARMPDVTRETIGWNPPEPERRALRRVRGAVQVEQMGLAAGDATRENLMAAEKSRIAEAALAELPEKGAILIDAGTTTAQVADMLPSDRDLTVVTLSVSIALTLAPRPNITTLLVGGQLGECTHATVGSWALQTLENTFVEVAFIGTSGVSLERGLTTPDPIEAMVKRAAIASAGRSVLLADHTKFGDDHFMRFADLSDIDTVITDQEIDTATAASIRDVGLKMVTV